MVMKSKTEFEWYINLHADAPRFMQENDERRLNEPYEVKAAKTIEMRERYYSPMFTLYINFDEVRAFKKKFGKYIRSNQWEDIVMKVYMR